MEGARWICRGLEMGAVENRERHLTLSQYSQFGSAFGTCILSYTVYCWFVLFRFSYLFPFADDLHRFDYFARAEFEP